MSTKIRLPNITATTDSGKLAQVQSYMYQLVEQLNMALQTVEQSSASKTPTPAITASGVAQKEAEAQSTFGSIKSLIIKSADIVNAYYDKISARLDGMYVAESDFGTFVQQTSNEIQATSEFVEQFYTNTQQILSEIQTEVSKIDVTAHIKAGVLYEENGVPVYGLEIGQRTEADGVETFNKYARFTSNKLSFYDQNDNEVAYISDQKLFITHVEITGSYKISGLVDTVLADGSVVTKWVGGGS